MLEDVSGVGETVGIGDERFSDVGERVFSLDGSGGAGEVFGENAVAGEHPENTLEVLGITGVWEEEAREDLGSGERRVGSVVPDSVGDA